MVARTGLTFGEITDALHERSAELASGDGSENTYKMLCYAANELDARLDSSLELCTENGENLARVRQAARGGPRQAGAFRPGGHDPQEAEIHRILTGMGQPPPRAPRRRQVHVHTVGDDDYAEHPVGAVSTANRAHGGRDHSDKRQPPLGGKRFPRVGEPAAGDGSWGTGGSEGIAARNRRSGMFRTEDPETGSTITSAKRVQARQREAGLSAGGVRWTRRGLARPGVAGCGAAGLEHQQRVRSL